MDEQPIGYQPPDYLERYGAVLERTQILALRQERQNWLVQSPVQPYAAAVASLQDIQPDWWDFSGPVVAVGRAGSLAPEQHYRLYQALRTFCPWKKGPFNLFGIAIDAEWRSDWKWARLLPHIQPLHQRRVADIGCHNGYFMFRMTVQQPDCVIGFEPIAKHYWNFQLLQTLARQDTLHFELLGIEHIHLYPQFFDTIFCLGILYHHPDPIGLLGKLHQALSPSGELVIDCQGIPGDLPIALTPRKRYAQARGIWFLPTQTCLETWLARAGFVHTRTVFAAPLSPAEQRRTPWAEIDSLAEFLDPQDSSLTIEGYPAPWRYYSISQKP
jgi:tRNA (mo5U34)-methyltransferase